MKRRSTSATNITPDSSVYTGEHCPESGWWFTASDEMKAHPATNKRFISEGSLMPAVEGSPVKWFPTWTGN